MKQLSLIAISIILLLSSCGINKFEKKPKVFFDTKSKAEIRSAILIDNGKLYFGNENCEFYAINISNKKKLWVYNTDLAVETLPVAVEDKIIFNAGNTLYILNAENGKEIHKIIYHSKNSIRASKDQWTFNDSHTAVSNGIAYYLSLDGELVSVDIKNGNILWTLSPESPGVVSSGISFNDGKLYYVDNAGFICCVDIKDKQFSFRTYIGDRVYAPIHISEGMLYAGGRSTRMYCVDGNSGEVKWATSSFTKSTWFSGGSVSIGNTLYAGTSDEHAIVSIDKNTGELLHLYPTELNVYTQPVLNGENIIAVSTFNNSYVMEYDTKNNKKLWQGQIEENVFSSPAIYKGVLYFGSDSGKIYSIKLN